VVFHIAGSVHIFRLEAAALKFVERLRDTVCSSRWPEPFKRPRCGMPITISSNTQTAPPRLMICSMAGMTAFRRHPNRKRLVPIYLTWKNFSKPSASTSLFRIARRPFFVKVDFLADTLRCVLSARRHLFRIGNMHVLQGEGAAIGALDDINDLAHRLAILQAQHIVDKDGPIQIGIGETRKSVGPVQGCGVSSRMPSGSRSAIRWPRMR
jgi:hypothetical protein